LVDLPPVFVYEERNWGIAARIALETSHTFIGAVEVSYDDLGNRSRGPLQVLSGLPAEAITEDTCSTIPFLTLAVVLDITTDEFADAVGVGVHQLYQMCRQALPSPPNELRAQQLELEDEIRRRRANSGEYALARPRDTEVLRTDDNDEMQLMLELNPAFETVPTQELVARLRSMNAAGDAVDADRARVLDAFYAFEFRERERRCIFYDPVPPGRKLLDALYVDSSFCWQKCVVIASSDSSGRPEYPRVAGPILALIAEIDSKALKYVTDRRAEERAEQFGGPEDFREGTQEDDDISSLPLETIMGFVPGYVQRAAAREAHVHAREMRDAEVWAAHERRQMARSRLAARQRAWQRERALRESHDDAPAAVPARPHAGYRRLRPAGYSPDLDPLERAASAHPFGTVGWSPPWRVPQPDTPGVASAYDDHDDYDDSDSKSDGEAHECESKESDDDGGGPRGKRVVFTAPGAGGSVATRLRRPPTPMRQRATGAGAGSGRVGYSDDESGEDSYNDESGEDPYNDESDTEDGALLDEGSETSDAEVEPDSDAPDTDGSPSYGGHRWWKNPDAAW